MIKKSITTENADANKKTEDDAVCQKLEMKKTQGSRLNHKYFLGVA